LSASREHSVVLTDVSKWFGDVVAVSDVSLAFGPGVTGLLGPNGAGKSTVLRMIAGLARPSQGQVRVQGKDPAGGGEGARAIGIAPQQEALFDRYTAHEFVRVAAVLHGVQNPGDAATHALVRAGMDPELDRPIATFSKGMRQRTKLAQALVNDPSVLLLDEPLKGLDPRGRREMIEVFSALGEEGRVVIVSSHVLEDVARFGSRIAVISQGRLAAEGDYHEIRTLLDDRPRRVRIRSDRPRQLTAALVSEGLCVGAHLGSGGEITVETNRAFDLQREILPQAMAVDAVVSEFVPIDEDLESVFKYLVAD
jgi:ABC-2 type transport system ATP-binding protein